jgi:plasmid stabilization system protein ParE
MAFRVVLTVKAEADVDAVLKWFSDRRVRDAGGRWYGQLIAKLGTLENHPERCALAAESEDLGQEIRELLLGRRRYRYRILFKITDETVVILRVWHGARDAITGEDLSEG